MQFSMNNLCRYLLLPVITSNHIRSGDKGIRTLDPLLARQVLSQLSYTPVWWTFRDSNPGPTGYEPVALTN